MMNYTDYHWVAWLITLALGLPVLWVTVRKWWAQAQKGFSGKFIICFIVACIITPYFRSETLNGVTDADIIPLSALFVRGLFAVLVSGFWVGFEVVMISIPLLSVASLFLAAIWSFFFDSRVRTWLAEGLE